MIDVVPMALGAFGAIAILLLLRRMNLASSVRRAAAAAVADDYRRMRDKADLAVVCPVCGGLAEPLRLSHDGYSCIACGHRFRAELHEWQDG